MTTERVAMVIYLLTANRGVKYTTADLARRVGMTHSAAYKLLCKASRVSPLVNDINGWWMAEDIQF